MAIMVLHVNPQRNGPLQGAIMQDLREHGATEDLHKARAVWGAASEVEAVDEDRFILLLWSGPAVEISYLGTRAA